MELGARKYAQNPIANGHLGHLSQVCDAGWGGVRCVRLERTQEIDLRDAFEIVY
jgi:hypothetical protein